jgi:YVTN family beta-propeller protein
VQKRLEFRILGPLEVRANGEPLALGGPKQRALLAFLLLEANRVVSRDRLIDELVGEPSGEAAEHALSVQVSRLRGALNAGGEGQRRLVTRAPGYLLRVEPGELDLHRFEELAAEGRQAIETHDLVQAAAKLREAESLWRGRPLADLELEPFGRLEVERLEELRLATVEDRIEAELALGRHTVVTPELQTLVARYPLRERLRGQLMLALYRSGRQAEALEVYRSGRSLLIEELALDPSPRLKALQQAILRQEARLDPLQHGETAVALATPASQPVPAAVVGLEPDPQRAQPKQSVPPCDGDVPRPNPARPRASRVPSGVLLLLVAAVAGIAAFVASGSHATARVVAANSVGVIDPRTNRLVGQVQVGARPGPLAVGASGVWVANIDDGTISRIDARARRVVRTIPLNGAIPSSIAVGGGAVWVADGARDAVLRVSAALDRVVRVVPAGCGATTGAAPPASVATGDRAAWFVCGVTLARIDPATDRARSVDYLGMRPTAITAGLGALWVANGDENTVARLDPQTLRITDRVTVGAEPSSIVVRNNAVWVAAVRDDVVSRVAGHPLGSDSIAVGAAPDDVAAGEGAIWVANGDSGTVSRIDPRTGEVVATIRVGNRPAGIAAGKGAVWVAVQAKAPAGLR